MTTYFTKHRIMQFWVPVTNSFCEFSTPNHEYFNYFNKINIKTKHYQLILAFSSLLLSYLIYSLLSSSTCDIIFFHTVLLGSMYYCLPCTFFMLSFHFNFHYLALFSCTYKSLLSPPSTLVALFDYCYLCIFFIFL